MSFTLSDLFLFYYPLCKAAHASLDGDKREVNFEDYQKLVGKVSTVISTLFDIRLMLQSLEK